SRSSSPAEPFLLYWGELRAGPLGVDDELEWIHPLVAQSYVVERTALQRRQRLTGRIAHEPQLRELERQHVVAALGQSAHGPNESVLALPSEQVERRRPLGGREHLHAFTVRLPVAGGLVIDALDEVVAHDEVGQDGLGVLAQRGRQDVVVKDFR